jgi:hypothetical protein
MATSAMIYLDESGVERSGVYVVLHELGHILGLGDFANDFNSCPYSDIMCYQVTNNEVYPSTLDLYAIHLIAGGQLEISVQLPSKIPYSYFSPAFAATTTSIPISEYVPNGSLALAVVFALALGLVVTKRAQAKTKTDRYHWSATYQLS